MAFETLVRGNLPGGNYDVLVGECGLTEDDKVYITLVMHANRAQHPTAKDIPVEVVLELFQAKDLLTRLGDSGAVQLVRDRLGLGPGRPPPKRGEATEGGAPGQGALFNRDGTAPGQPQRGSR